MKLSNQTKMQIDVVNVGHGDCTIITWENGISKDPWHCIIDAGKISRDNVKAIDKVINERKIKEIDLCIVSHFDTDHIDGFHHIIKNVKIKKYWSPYTPAFEKYLWLFGQRGKKAIERAKNLEIELLKNDVILESPVEGHISKPSHGIKISVISPPVKFYEKLLSGSDVQSIFEQYPTFLGDLLIEDSDIVNEEGTDIAVRGMYARSISGIIKRDIEQEREELVKSKSIKEEINIDKDKICKEIDIEPDFFGNNVLNDTSLVLKIEFWTGTKWYSMLFPGDLENWLYVISKQQQNLISDLYKASHHGGRVYIGKQKAADEIIQAIRPNIAIISANGQHKLPRNQIRNSLVRWSSNIFCTQSRTCEKFSISGSLPIEEECCSNIYNCSAEASSIHFEFEQGEVNVTPKACHISNSSSFYPIIQFEQHLIPDSKVLTLLTEREIDEQTKWVVRKLKEIHDERKHSPIVLESDPITVKEIYYRGIKESQNLTEKQVCQVLEYGHSKGKLWAAKGNWSNFEYAYLKPSKSDVSTMYNIIAEADLLLFGIEKVQKGISSNILNVNRDLLCNFIEKRTAFPSDVINDYCWPLLVDKICKNYRGYYVYNNFCIRNNKKQWLMIVKKEKNFRSIIEEEMKSYLDDSSKDYDKYEFEEYCQEYIYEESSIKIGSVLSNDNWRYDERNAIKKTLDNIYDFFIEYIIELDSDDFTVKNIW